MSKFLTLMLFVMFIAICIKLINESEWYLVASLIVGLLTSKEQLQKIWEDADNE